MTEGKDTRIGRYDLVRYSCGAILTCSDIATDILTAISYHANHQFVWFTFCLTFALLPSFLVTFAFLVQHWKGASPSSGFLKRFVFFANPFGSAVLKGKLLIVCLRNIGEVWSDRGYRVEDERLCEDYRSEKVYHYVEGLLENMPQIILQIYVTIVQDERITVLQISSISVTFMNLVWVLATFEYNSFVRDAEASHLIVIMIYNACLVAARGLSIVAFLVAFKWFTTIILAFHEFVCISIYFYKNHQYFSAREVWWTGSLVLPCYVFVFLGFKVKVLHSKVFEIKLGRSMLSSALFYFCFIAENVVMMSLFFSWSTASGWRWSRWITGVVTAAAIVLSLLGTLIQLAFTFVFFYKRPSRVGPTDQDDLEAPATRPGMAYLAPLEQP